MEVCRKHGVAYPYFSGFPVALFNHFKYAARSMCKPLCVT